MKVALAVLVFAATALASFALGGLAVTVQLTSPLDDPAVREQTVALATTKVEPPKPAAPDKPLDPEQNFQYRSQLSAKAQAEKQIEVDAKLRPLREKIAEVTAPATNDRKGVSRNYEQIALLLGAILLLLAVSDLVYQNVFVPAEEEAAGAA